MRHLSIADFYSSMNTRQLNETLHHLEMACGHVILANQEDTQCVAVETFLRFAEIQLKAIKQALGETTHVEG